MYIVFNFITNDFVAQKDFSLDTYTKNFTVGQINERMRYAQLDPKIRCRYMIADYKKYYESNSKKLLNDSKKCKLFIQLFTSDFMTIFNSIVEEIEGGRQLNTLMGLQALPASVTRVGKDLSLIYRRALKSQANSGIPSPAIYKELVKIYKEFFHELTVGLFPGMEKVNMDEIQLRVSI